MAQVPTLELTDGDRTVRLAQSLAIIEYLEELYPTPRLYPADRFLRARARQIAEVVNAGIQPFQNLPALAYVREQLGGDDKAFAQRWNARGLEALEKLVPETAGKFCIGDEPTIADVCLIPQIYSARRFGVPLDGFPTLLGIEAACNALPAFVNAHPDQQPDAPRS
jgi:maleylpyruvate isomerase